MLFFVGVGIGILFFGVVELVFYFDNFGVFGYLNNLYVDLNGYIEMDM